MRSSLMAWLSRILLLIACGISALGTLVISVRMPLLALVVAIAIAWRRWRTGYRTSATTHGSATVSTTADLEKRGMLGSEGLLLGRCLPEPTTKAKAVTLLLSPSVSAELAVRHFLDAFYHRHWVADRFIRLRSFVHLATFAPAGAGKGVACLIPNLRSYPHSCVVTDPKGELFTETARHRETVFGHKIIRLDPYGVCGPGGDTLNPLDFVDATQEDCLDRCNDLSDRLIVRTPGTKNPFFDESAAIHVTAFSVFTCCCEPKPELRNLNTVRTFINSKHAYEQAVTLMQQSNIGIVKQQGGPLSWYVGETQASVLATLQRHTAWLSSPIVARNVTTSSFDPKILRTGRATIYLILPADQLVVMAPLLRMWIGTIMREITRGKPTEANPVVWFLDEMGHIGDMRVIRDAVTLMRGMGMRLWFFFQSLEQLKTCFGDYASTVLDNIGTCQYVGITSFATAEELSKRIGDATIRIRSDTETTSESRPVGGNGPNGPGPGSHSTSRGSNDSDIGRRLLKPEEVLTLSQEISLTFHQNMPVIPARLVRYHNAPEFRRSRTGRQRSLGLAAAFMAASTVAMSVVFTGIAASIPAPQTTPRPAVGMPARPSYGMQPLPSPHYYGMPTPRSVRSRNASRRPGTLRY